MVLDFSSGVHYVLALLPEVVLSCWGMLLLVMGVVRKRGEGRGSELGFIALAGRGLTAIANGWLYSGVSEASQAGMIMVNRPTAGVDYHVPFGGTKGSSYGSREQGSYAAEFYTTVKTSYTLP